MKQKWQSIDMGDGYLKVYYAISSTIVYVLNQCDKRKNNLSLGLSF